VTEKIMLRISGLKKKKKKKKKLEARENFIMRSFTVCTHVKENEMGRYVAHA